MKKLKQKYLEKQREKCSIFQKKRFVENGCSNLKGYPLRNSCKGSGYREKPNKLKGVVSVVDHKQYNYIKKYCVDCPYYIYYHPSDEELFKHIDDIIINGYKDGIKNPKGILGKNNVEEYLSNEYAEPNHDFDVKEIEIIDDDIIINGSKILKVY